MGKYLDKEGVEQLWEATKGCIEDTKFTPGTGLELTKDNTLNVTLDTTVFKVVDSLPEQPDKGDENKFYLVPNNIPINSIYVDLNASNHYNYTKDLDKPFIDDPEIIKALKINGKIVTRFTVQNDGDGIYRLTVSSLKLTINFTDESIDVSTENTSLSSVIEFYSTAYSDDNIYSEYLFINDKWELIGTINSDNIDVDLSNYVTKANLSKEVKDINQTLGDVTSELFSDIDQINDYLTPKKKIIDTLKLLTLEVSDLSTISNNNSSGTPVSILSDCSTLKTPFETLFDFNTGNGVGNLGDIKKLPNNVKIFIYNKADQYFYEVHIVGADISFVSEVSIYIVGYYYKVSTTANLWRAPITAVPITIKLTALSIEISHSGNIIQDNEWTGTQAEYDALGTYDDNCKYYILED